MSKIIILYYFNNFDHKHLKCLGGNFFNLKILTTNTNTNIPSLNLGAINSNEVIFIPNEIVLKKIIKLGNEKDYSFKHKLKTTEASLIP